MRCPEIEVYLSGFLDDELTQQQKQQVRVHLSDCRDCRDLLEELSRARDAARTLPLPKPGQEEWKTMENQILQRITRGLAWVILTVWSVFTGAYALFHYATAPEEPLLHKVIVFGFFLGLALLFFSVLMERMRESRTDRYRGVQK